MFRRAVICTDLTQSSASVVACAGALGELGVREAVLTHVIDMAAATERPADAAAFSRQAEMLEQAGIEVSVDAVIGYPPYEIETVADRHRADIIVMGSHRKGLYPAAFSGSTSSDVIRISTRPVLLVALEVLGAPEHSAAVCARLLSRVLYLTDFSPSSEIAAGYLRALADKGLREAELLHVLPVGSGSYAERRRAALARLESLASDLARAGVKAIAEVGIGSPPLVAAERATAGRYTMIMVAPHHEPNGPGMLESVTNAVIRTTAAPLLVIPRSCRPAAANHLAPST